MSITLKLQNTICFSLISDIWTTKNLQDFLPMNLNISNIYYKRELLVIGMIKLPCNHNADRIKEAIEDLVNSF